MPERCYAPLFVARGPVAALGARACCIVAILGLLVLTLGLVMADGRGRCLIKQYRFRFTHCRDGNVDRNLVI